MNHNYLRVIACVLLSFCGYSLCIAQSTGPEFLTCSDSILRLCVQDEGVRLPDNNQVYLGEDHPDATSCSVHITQKNRVRATCGDTLQYEALLFLNDTSPAIPLTAMTSIVIDSTGEVDLILDSALSPDSSIRQAGIPYNLDCNDKHRIVWTVVDSCGQETSCTSYHHFYDCDKPIPKIPSSYFYMYIPLGCQLSMYAVDFDPGALDDCSLRDHFAYSFYEDWQNPDTLITCPEAFGVELPWKMWIADEGVDLNCDGQIEWTERNREEQSFNVVFGDNGICDCHMVTGYDISGKVVTEALQGIKGVEISLHAPGHVFPTYITESDGKYFFYDINVSDELTIKAYKNDFHRNGVSTLDLVKIQKHLLGKEVINNPYKIIAADANNSQNVSAIDLIELRKLILGIYTEFPANTSWKFVRADYIFQDTMNPWPYEDPGTITITDLANPGNLDFIGIKIGDINGTAQPNVTQLLPRQSFSRFGLTTLQQSFQAGDIINIPIRISSDQTLSGFQFTMSAAGMEVINIFPGVIPVAEEHYALFGDKFTMSWFDENNMDVAADDVLFTLQLRAVMPGNISQSLSINSDITGAELYLANEETFLPVLVVQDQHTDGKLQITSCAPNPWKEESIVNFYLPHSDEVTFTLFDVSGREVYSETQFLKNGHHQHQLKSSELSARGMMFFEISTSKDKSFQKMIVQD